MTMTAAELQLGKVREALACIDRRDTDGFMAFWTDDVVWQMSGSGPFGGAYRGKDAVRGLSDALMGVIGPSYSMEPVDVLADDRHVVIMFHVTGERDGTSIDMTNSTFVTVADDGRWNQAWWVPSDQKSYDQYFR